MGNNSKPRIERITPDAAIPGGEVVIAGSGFSGTNSSRPRVTFGDAEGSLLVAGANHLIAQVPEGSAGNQVKVSTGAGESEPFAIHLGVQVADNLHPVANPAVDADGNIYVTFSGQRGQKVPVSLYKVTPAGQIKPFVTEMMNPSGLAVDRAGVLYVSCRNDGTIHRVTPEGRAELWMEGMGIATGIAFDAEQNLFVGDRSGTIFKISPDRQVFVFATLEPSIAAYHLAFSPNGNLYVTGPTTSSFDHVLRIDRSRRNQPVLIEGLWAGPKAWRLTATAIFTWPHRKAAGGASFAFRRTPRGQKWCWAAPVSWVLPCSRGARS